MGKYIQGISELVADKITDAQAWGETLAALIHGDHLELAEAMSIALTACDEFHALAFEAGRSATLSEIDRTALLAPTAVDSLDALEWAKAFGSGRINVTPSLLAPWFALAIEAGRQANKVQGLNGDDDGVALDQPEANAVCLYVTHDRSLSMEVDGRTRVRLGVVNSVQLVNDGNREVIVEPLDI